MAISVGFSIKSLTDFLHQAKKSLQRAANVASLKKRQKSNHCNSLRVNGEAAWTNLISSSGAANTTNLSAGKHSGSANWGRSSAKTKP